jgi:long-subunit fatty acid transport protein
MSLVKYAGVSLIAMSASMGHAGGMEATALSAGFMFEDGNYGSVSVQSQSPSLKAVDGTGASITSGSVIGSVTSTNIKAKADVLDNLSVGITYYRQAGIKLDYQSVWTYATAPLVAAAMPKVDLDVTALTALAKYGVNQNFSVLAGLKSGTASNATAVIPSSAVSGAATGKDSLSYVAGVAYEMPEIAFRAELVYETSAEFSLPTTFVGQAQPGTIDASTPTYTNLYVQSGIAEDTLLFGSLRQADWGKNQVSYTYSGAAAVELSSFENSTSYEIGLGRKFGDTWSSSIAYNWEDGSGTGTTTSPFTLSDGRQGLSVGAKYSLNENTSISLGGNYTKFGDISAAWTGALGGKFSGNSTTTLGANISHSF